MLPCRSDSSGKARAGAAAVRGPQIAARRQRTLSFASGSGDAR